MKNLVAFMLLISSDVAGARRENWYKTPASRASQLMKQEFEREDNKIFT